jgi:glycosyltransferase involved in cell wall biosynthesis
MALILINATATRSSGALTILKDCIYYLESFSEDKMEYHLCTVIDDFDFSKNVRIHKIRPQSWLERIRWDNGGLQKWCRRNKLEPDLIISLQNTSTRYVSERKELVPQLVYYHQPLPLISYTWNIFNRQEFILFLYAHFYYFFVIKNNQSSYYVVQLSYIRKLFLEKFKKVRREDVFVIRPNNPLIDASDIPEVFLEHDLFTFFYPATALKYKNHKILIQALILLKEKYSSVLHNIRIIFTVETLGLKLMKMIKKYDLSNNIQLIGKKSYNEILSYYKSVDALLFPSQIETFGLPLVEAACFGLPIIAADLPYAHEVLENYPDKKFVDPENKDGWANIIRNYKRFEKMFPIAHPDACANKNSWGTFFNLAEKILVNKSI